MGILSGGSDSAGAVKRGIGDAVSTRVAVGGASPRSIQSGGGAGESSGARSDA